MRCQQVWFVKDLRDDFWQTDSIRIRDFLVPGANTKVHFLAADNQFENPVEAAIDVFRVVDMGPVSTDVPQVAERNLVAVPNPSSGDFSLRFNLGGSDEGHLRLFDLQGRELQSFALQNQKGQVTIREAELPQGIYLAVLESGGHAPKTLKLLRQ